MICKFKSSLNRLIQASKQFSTLQKKEGSQTVTRRDRLQFSKKRLVDFGELPQGEIPEALQYDHPHSITKLQNGINVATETWNSPLASISVAVKAGTRQETLETSGVCQFIERLSLRGTTGRSREQVEQDLQSLGGNLDIKTSRELTTYTLTFQKENTDKAVAFLGDILFNSLYNANQIEAEKEEVYRKAAENHRDQMSTTIESVHATSYRDHFMGQPVYGIRENIHSITQEHIKQYHAANYIAPNITIAGAGNIQHDRLVDLANKAFEKVPTSGESTPAKRNNSDIPYFTPSLMYMRDDEMCNVNVGVFFNAPHYTHSDYFSMRLFEQILGE